MKIAIAFCLFVLGIYAVVFLFADEIVDAYFRFDNWWADKKASWWKRRKK